MAKPRSLSSPRSLEGESSRHKQTGEGLRAKLEVFSPRADSQEHSLLGERLREAEEDREKLLQHSLVREKTYN